MPEDKDRLQRFQEKVLTTRRVGVVGPLSTAYPTDLENAAEYALLGVDGGARFGRSRFDLTIGDGDSLPTDLPPHTLDFQLCVDKDKSDLAFALDCLPRGPWSLELWGFSGGRFDHDILNLGTLARWVEEEGGKVRMYHSDCQQLMVLPAGSHHLLLEGVFSLFSLREANWSIAGDCRFPLLPTRLPALDSRTLSNQGLGRVDMTVDQVFFCHTSGVDGTP